MDYTVFGIPENKFVLIVEDNEERIEWFKNALSGMRYQICMTPYDALAWLDSSTPDVVFLDHDAVPMFVQPEDPDFSDLSFYRVAQRLARDNFSGLVVIHSGNPVGALRMANLISEKNCAKVLKAPFGSFKIAKVYV